MILSKKLKKYNFISHGFFGLGGGISDGIYKSLNCGFGSNDKGYKVRDNIKLVSKKIGCQSNKIIFNNQIHSKKIFFFKKKFKKRLKGDGSLTKTKGVALAVLTADCAPVIFVDIKKKIIGVAHAGWKGALKGIIKNMISCFINNGSSKKDIIVAIGPTIDKKSYEVKNDFKKKFLKKDLKNEKFFVRKKTKIFFHLQGYIIDQLNSAGIDQVDVIKRDTFNIKNNLFSARRSLKNGFNDYGRNISIIMIK